MCRSLDRRDETRYKQSETTLIAHFYFLMNCKGLVGVGLLHLTGEAYDMLNKWMSQLFPFHLPKNL
jgi:hypothetical protein